MMMNQNTDQSESQNQGGQQIQAQGPQSNSYSNLKQHNSKKQISQGGVSSTASTNIDYQ